MSSPIDEPAPPEEPAGVVAERGESAAPAPPDVASPMNGSPAPTTPSKGNSRRWLSVLKGVVAVALAVSLLLTLFITGRLDPGKLLQVFDHPWLVLLAQVFFLSQLFLTFLRWRLLLLAFQIDASARDVIRLGWIGLLFSQVIPGSTGGDVVKGFYIARETPHRRAAAVLSVVLDRVVGMAGLMLLGITALALNASTVAEHPRLRGVAIAVGGTFALLLCLGALFCWESFWRHPRWERVTRRLPGRRVFAGLIAALWQLGGKRRTLVTTLLVSVLAHGCGILMHICLAGALLGAAGPSAGEIFFLVPVGQLITALPLTPAGAGIGETAYSFLFEAIQQENGADLMLMVRLCWIFWALAGIYFYLQGKKGLQEAARVAEEDLKEEVSPSNDL